MNQTKTSTMKAMKLTLQLSIVIIFICCCITSATAQTERKAYFQSGTVDVTENITDFINALQPKSEMNGYYYRFIQFKSLPTATQREVLRSNGLLLMDYIPNNTFMAAIPVNFNRTLLKDRKSVV